MKTQELVTQVDGEDTVNARDLHAALGVGRDFSNWIRGRISEYGFVENEEYVVEKNFDSPNLANQRKDGRGGDRRSVSYHLSIGMAKQLAMVENNEVGKRIRLDFLRMEEEHKKLLESNAAGVEAERRMQITDDDLKPKYSALAMWRGFMSPTSTRSLKKSILTTLYNLAYAHPVSAEIVKTSDDKRDFLLSPHLALVALQSMFKEEEKRFDDADLKDIDARGKFELLKEHRDEVRAEISGEHPSMSRLTTDNALLKSETHLLE